MSLTRIVDGPFFDDLAVGFTIRDAPSITLTEGLAALHGAIVGDRMRLPLDHHLSRAVTGGVIAHPALVWDTAIGQSTVMTRRVLANLFYRGMVFQRFPEIGDTLYTTTEIVGMRQNRPRPGRAATGLGVMRIRTVDQAGRPILDFRRCAMFPLRDPNLKTGHDAELADDLSETSTATLSAAIKSWDLSRYHTLVPQADADPLEPGTTWEVVAGDVVSLASALARSTLNLAMVHHDRSAPERLVYGGHTIGLAAAQASRALPNLVTIVGWHGCDHLAPVREGDVLRSTLELERLDQIGSGQLAHLRSRVRAFRAGESSDVLDWRFVGVIA